MAKFYAVKQGVKPGIYTTWSECNAQVLGYKGAQYKAFSTEEEARAFVFGDLIAKNNSLSEEDKENVKCELLGIKEGLKERDIMFILDKVSTIAEILNIELDPDDLEDYKR